MNATHGLGESTVEEISAILARFPEVESAVLFGSRAKGTFRRGSDIDLALVGNSIRWETIAEINGAFDDSPLPWMFSLVHFGPKTDPDLAGHIRRVGQPFYTRSGVAKAREPVT